MSIRSTNTKDPPRNFLPPSFTPHDTDVLIGRGRRVVNHPGNKKFRALVNGNLAAYSLAETKSKKSNIIVAIFQVLTTASSETTGFVKLNKASKRWYVIDYASARISIAQAFRDALSFEYKSSKQYKQKKRQEERGELLPLSGLLMTQVNAEVTNLAPPPLVPQVSVDQSSFQYRSSGLIRLRSFLDKASHVVADEGDDYCGSTSVPQGLLRSNQDDVFSSLYSAFGARKVDLCVDPFEPTPMAETPLGAVSELPLESLAFLEKCPSSSV